MTNKECTQFLKALTATRTTHEKLLENFKMAAYGHACGFAATGYLDEGYSAMRTKDNERYSRAENELIEFLHSTLYPMLSFVCTRSKQKNKYLMYLIKFLSSPVKRELYNELEMTFSILKEVAIQLYSQKKYMKENHLDIRYVCI